MKLSMILSACFYKARLLSKVCLETGMLVPSGSAHLQALGFSGFVKIES